MSKNLDKSENVGKSKGMLVAGIVLLVIGSVLLVLGIVLPLGSLFLFPFSMPFFFFPMMGGGFMLFFILAGFGGVLLFIGIPLTIIGRLVSRPGSRIRITAPSRRRSSLFDDDDDRCSWCGSRHCMGFCDDDD